MVSLEALSGEFEAIGIDAKQDILLKCLEICDNCGIGDAEEFVEQWMAYSISKLNGTEPTVALLSEFEHKGLKQVAEQPEKQRKVRNNFPEFDDATFETRNSSSSLLSTYGAHLKEHNDDSAIEPMDGVEPIAEARSLDNHSSGQAIYTFGRSSNWSTNGRRKANPSVVLLGNDNGETLTNKQKYMFETIPDKSAYLKEILFNLGKEISDMLKFHDSQQLQRFSQVDTPSQEKQQCVGRVAYENDNKLTPNSAVLIGTDSGKLRKVSLNFNRLPSFNLFPGQIIFANGMNPNGDQFFLTYIKDERDLEPPKQPNVTETINLVIAGGPFTSQNDLRYQYLENLLNWCRNNQPDVLVLIGPFLDENHPKLETLNESFECFFDKIINKIIEALQNDSSHTQVLVIGSQTDIVSTNVYPTHPLTSMRTYPNLRFLPNPATVDIGGCVFGFSATDVLTHFNQEELAINCGPDKVKRFVKYLLNQKSFYPITPPHPEMNVDIGMMSKYGRLKSVPHFLIIPSEMKPFARNIDGCLAVNPGRLFDETLGGSFARLVINPPSSKTSNMMEYIGCQILKI